MAARRPLTPAPAPAPVSASDDEYTDTFETDSEDEYESDDAESISFERRPITPPFIILPSGERITPRSLLTAALRHEEKSRQKKKKNGKSSTDSNSEWEDSDSETAANSPKTAPIPIPGRITTITWADPVTATGILSNPASPDPPKWYNVGVTNNVPFITEHHTLVEIRRDPFLPKEEPGDIPCAVGWHNERNQLRAAGYLYDYDKQQAHRAEVRKKWHRDWICCACKKPNTTWAIKCPRCGRHEKGRCCKRVEPEPKVNWKAEASEAVEEFRAWCRAKDEENAKGPGMLVWTARLIMGK